MPRKGARYRRDTTAAAVSSSWALAVEVAVEFDFGHAAEDVGVHGHGVCLLRG
jgi:hypothetical protein